MAYLIHIMNSKWSEFMPRISFHIALTVAGLLVLAGCGQTVGDRALSGGAIGAGAGAIGGLLLGSPATGAAIGGAIGAAAGAVTDNSEVNLGKPIWRQ